MIIKVNRVKNEIHLKAAKKATHISMTVSEQALDYDSNAISTSKVAQLLKSLPNKEVETSLYFPSSTGVPIKEQLNIVQDLGVGYLELICPDFYKEEAFNGFLSDLKKIDFPVILSGFHFMKGDFQLQNDFQYFHKLAEMTVEFFQVEVDSFFDPESKISSKQTFEFEQLCLQLPIVYSDKFEMGDYSSIRNVMGRYFTLQSSRSDGYQNPHDFPDFAQELMSTNLFSTRAVKVCMTD